jgi:hypothetical protein
MDAWGRKAVLMRPAICILPSHNYKRAVLIHNHHYRAAAIQSHEIP